MTSRRLIFNPTSPQYHAFFFVGNLFVLLPPKTVTSFMDDPYGGRKVIIQFFKFLPPSQKNTHTHARTRTHTHAHARTRTHTHAHAHARTHTHAHARTHTRAHARTRRTHTHARTPHVSTCHAP